MKFVCAFCKQPLSPGSTYTSELITGWVDHRKGGGAHGVRLMSPPKALAHRHCLDEAVNNWKNNGDAKHQYQLQFEEEIILAEQTRQSSGADGSALERNAMQ